MPEVDKVGQPKPTRRPLTTRRKLLLVTGALLLVLVSLEFAYRLKLFVSVGHLPLGMSQSYELFNDQWTVPDERLGYRLKPNTDVLSLRVTNELPVLLYQRSINEIGNLGPPKPHCESARLKVLVFGDSYTAFPGGGTVWPTVLENLLQEKLQTEVCVLNFGRAGYGVLQIVDLAADTIAQFQPDLVLIAFISDDLNRDRLLANPPPRQVPGGFLDKTMTVDWCRSILASQNRNDPRLQKFNQEFAAAKSGADKINYLDPMVSFLLNRLVRDDPFFHRADKALNRRTRLSSFSDDQQFVEALTTIKETNVPYFLVRLPEHRELVANKYLLTWQQRSLLSSLRDLTGKQTVDLIDQKDASADVDDWFLLPHDPHPAAAGLEFYARSVLKRLGTEFENAVRPPQP